MIKKIAMYIADKLYIELVHFKVFHKRIELRNPKKFNEKLQWMKLYDRNLLYIKLVDKYELRKYITEQIGEQYLIPILGVWNNANEIDFSMLPNEFVLKCTHDSAEIRICKNKQNFNFEEAINFLNVRFSQNFYYLCREWLYKKVKPRIITEKYMVDELNEELKDYKFFCFEGKVEFIQVDYGRFTEHIYDINWNLLKIKYQYDYDETAEIKKTAKLDNMVRLSEKLSDGYPFLRIDFYSINNDIYWRNNIIS